MKRRRTVAVFLCVILLGGVMASYNGKFSEFVGKFFLYVQYREGAEFYRNSDEKTFRTDERWLSALLFESRNALLSGDARSTAPDPFRRVFGERNRSLSVFESLDPIRSESGYGYQIKKEYQRFFVDPWDSILIRPLYCGTYGFSDRDFSVLASIKLDGEYADTHKLLGLLFLRERGCYDRDVLDRMIRQGAEHIARSAESDPKWSDLFSERVVLLYWAGEGLLVKREWIDRIAAAQGKDGGWTDPTWSSGPNAHSTGLSMLAIRYFLEGNPKAEFFAPMDQER